MCKRRKSRDSSTLIFGITTRIGTGFPIVAGSLLEKWYGSDKLLVNSYHHQGVRESGTPIQADGLRGGRAD